MISLSRIIMGTEGWRGVGIVLSKPKLNYQLNSTEFEVRLHSYTEVHHPPPPPHKLNLYTQNWEELTTAQLARRDPLYKCTVTHRPVKQLCTMFSRPNFNFFKRVLNFEFWPPGLDLASRLICRSVGFMKVWIRVWLPIENSLGSN